MRPAVIAIGSRWRGDDAVGPLALDQVRSRLPRGVDAVELDGESTRILDAWARRPWVVVIDAIHGGRSPGQLHRVDPLSEGLTAVAGTSTHGGGLAEAVALGTALDRLPEHLVVLGLEPGSLEIGGALSAPVARGMPDLVAAVLAEVDSGCV
jgi:hydrogenase maturation protease